MSYDIDTVIEVDLDEILDAANKDPDGEAFLDLLETLVKANYDEEFRQGWVLSNYKYEAVGFNEETKLIRIQIQGDKAEY